LRKYLSEEWKARKQSEKKFTGKNIRCLIPEVPTQTNDTDCGVFLLLFAEHFCALPPSSFDSEKSLSNYFSEWPDQDVIPKKRQEIIKVIERLSSEQSQAAEDQIEVD